MIDLDKCSDNVTAFCAEFLAVALETCEPFYSKDSTRFHLQGLCIARDGNYLQATDGIKAIRLHVFKSDMKIGDFMPGEMIIPGNALKQLRKVLGKRATGTVLLDASGKFTLPSGLSFPADVIQSKFPPLDQVAPKYGRTDVPSSGYVGFNAMQMADCCKAAKTWLGGKSGCETRGIEWRHNDVLDPVLLRVDSVERGLAEIVLMPMRIE